MQGRDHPVLLTVPETLLPEVLRSCRKLALSAGRRRAIVELVRGDLETWPHVTRVDGAPDRADFDSAFPSSRKVYVEAAAGVRVPMREIALSGGEPPLRVYDTSGPQRARRPRRAADVRARWIVERARCRDDAAADAAPSARAAGRAVTQLHYARRGEVTPEMEFIAIREGFDAGVRPRRRSRAAAPSSPPTSIIPSSSR